MLRLALVLIIPSLIAADTTCLGGFSCPEGQTCCTVNNQPSCCDEAPLPFRPEMAAASNSSVQNGFFDNRCTLLTCTGTCCSTDYLGCCPFTGATCCANNKCCDFGNSCCGSGCCGFGFKCCGGGTWCCRKYDRCGLSYRTCYSGAGSLSPTTLVTLVAAWLVAYAVKKL